MSVVEKHSPGSFCWVELGTTNARAAKAFYGGLFGWRPDDMPMGNDQFYTMLQIDGKAIGALYELDEHMRRMGIPPHWLQYIAVADADETAARVKALGGTVMKDAFDVFDAGRMAVIQDPTGAVFAVWQANRNIGSRITGEPHTLCWSELVTNDTARSIEFYTKLFGWIVKAGLASTRDYTEIWNGNRSIGGVMQMSAELGDIPSHWMPYFLVAGCEASAGKSKELGGSVQVRPTDIPGVGRFAVIADPQGAVFSLFQPARLQ
jgi:predicted enzyme related to lactoylglutathione lyase